jgi:hypothetical protein
MSPWMAAAASVPLLLALHAPAAWAYSVPVAHRPVASLRRSALVRLQMPEAGAQIKSDETYRMMLSALLKTEKSVKSEISTNYAMVDYGFLQRLCARCQNAPAAAARRLRPSPRMCERVSQRRTHRHRGRRPAQT